MKKESELVKINKLHGRLVPFVVGVAIVVVLILAGLYRQGLLGPIRTGEYNGAIINWRVSDHRSSGDGLTNNISGTDEPEYSSEGVVVPLQRDNNGAINTLLRYQGELEYYKP